jgi:hypothetical protein
MIWNDMIWYMIWYMIYDMIWYDMIWYDMIWYVMIYLLTAIGLPPGGSCTIHMYTQTIHRTTHNKQYLEQHKIGAQHKIWEQYKKFGRVRAVARLGELYPGICLTAEEKAWKNLRWTVSSVSVGLATDGRELWQRNVITVRHQTQHSQMSCTVRHVPRSDIHFHIDGTKTYKHRR